MVSVDLWPRQRKTLGLADYVDRRYIPRMITPEQCRAARGLIGWSQERLAKAAGVGLSTVRNFEKGRSEPMRQNIEALIRVLEAEGAEFMDGPYTGDGGPGVRLRKV